MTRRRTAVTAAILAGALGLTACGTNRDEAAGGGSTGSCDVSKGTLVIGMIAPTSGGLSALGLGMQNSADLAVDQANQNCTVPAVISKAASWATAMYSLVERWKSAALCAPKGATDSGGPGSSRSGCLPKNVPS